MEDTKITKTEFNAKELQNLFKIIVENKSSKIFLQSDFIKNNREIPVEKDLTKDQFIKLMAAELMKYTKKFSDSRYKIGINIVEDTIKITILPLILTA
tara:strand:+ start:1721 stop:2014 length:294 start_codon:yes stop_codon:yes gene_type:complete